MESSPEISSEQAAFLLAHPEEVMNDPSLFRNVHTSAEMGATTFEMDRSSEMDHPSEMNRPSETDHPAEVDQPVEMSPNPEIEEESEEDQVPIDSIIGDTGSTENEEIKSSESTLKPVPIQGFDSNYQPGSGFRSLLEGYNESEKTQNAYYSNTYPDQIAPGINPTDMNQSNHEKEIPTQGGIESITRRELSANSTKSSARAETHFRILTWNIWFEDQNMWQRTERIIQTIRSEHPDIVCLQEATHPSFEQIEKGLRNEYTCFQIFRQEGNAYGTAILCRKDTVTVKDPYFYDYPETRMGRRLLGCEIQLKNVQKSIHILTTHLESLWENRDTRAQQFETIQEVIKNMSNLILLGDMNISSSNEPIQTLIGKSNLKDAWVQLGCPQHLKYTYDGQSNRNLGNRRHRSRLDRAYYRFEPSLQANLSGMEFLGMGATNPEIPEQPSDHYGLLIEITF